MINLKYYYQYALSVIVLAVLMSLVLPPAYAAQGAVVRVDRCTGLAIACSTMITCDCLEYQKECNGDLSSRTIANLKRKCKSKVKPVATQSQRNQCLDLELAVRKKSEALRSARARWKGIEKDYLSFYDSSKVTMQADFDKVYYEMPSSVPFSGSFNILIKVQTKQRLRHMPQIKLQITPGSLGDYQNFLTVVNDLSGLLGPSAALLSYSGVVKDWLGFWAGKTTVKNLFYDEGVAKYRGMMLKRQTILDNYRNYINQFFCKRIVRLEREVFTMRTSMVPKSGCPANVKSAMDGWLARHAAFNNPVYLGAIEKNCRGSQKAVR